MIDYTKTPDKDLQVITSQKYKYNKFKLLLGLILIPSFLFNFYQESKDIIIYMFNEYNKNKIVFSIILGVTIFLTVYKFRFVKR